MCFYTLDFFRKIWGRLLRGFPFEYTRKQSAGLRSNAFHWKTLESIPQEYARKHTLEYARKPSTGIRSKAFHWNTLESIPLGYARTHSTGIRSKAFYWNTLECIPLRKHFTVIRSKAYIERFWEGFLEGMYSVLFTICLQSRDSEEKHL